MCGSGSKKSTRRERLLSTLFGYFRRYLSAAIRLSMDLVFVIGLLVSSAWLYAALRYGIVGGAGAVSRRQEQPISYWIGVGLNVLIALGCVVALVMTMFFGGTAK